MNSHICQNHSEHYTKLTNFDPDVINNKTANSFVDKLVNGQVAYICVEYFESLSYRTEDKDDDDYWFENCSLRVLAYCPISKTIMTADANHGIFFVSVTNCVEYEGTDGVLVNL